MIPQFLPSDIKYFYQTQPTLYNIFFFLLDELSFHSLLLGYIIQLPLCLSEKSEEGQGMDGVAELQLKM